ncbi:MAG: asparagine synthase family protein [Promethearchaeota archaeon]
MVGIAGLLVTSEDSDSNLMLQKMSEAIKHRRCETYHTVNQSDSLCLIVGPQSFQGPKDVLFIIDFNEDLKISEDYDDITSIRGIFGVVAVIISQSRVSLLRTLDGSRTLYYAKIGNGFAFATERKSLWSIGIDSVQTVQPGQGIQISWDGNLARERFTTLKKPQRSQKSREETLDLLKQRLLTSFQRLKKDTSCAVLFSGGVDSTLAAVQTSRQCEDTLLVTTRSIGAHDDKVATKAAKQLGLPLLSVDLNPEVIWGILPEVIYSIETSRQMDVEIALPFYLASKMAADEDCTTVVSGQGPDELYAGYMKHVRTFTKDGPDALMEQLWKEVSMTHDANIERDDRAIAAHGLDSFFPYLDQEFVKASLSVPVEWKINPGCTPQRKVIFRELAQLMGVPEDIANAPKNATQYSSGSSKAILESIIMNVDGFKELSKKKASERVQNVLDMIASDLGMPTG